MERLLNSVFADRTSLLETYSFMLPIVYQIELVGGLCNLRCPVCPVANNQVPRSTTYMDIELIKQMIRRREFDNTFYIEFQMYGEPVLHPKFNEIIALFKKETNLKLGLSTNATIWKDGLEKVDFITISADSIEYRKQRNDEEFEKVVDKILQTNAKIDIQVLEIGDWREKVEQLQKIVQNRDNVLIRSISNCFIEKESKSAIEDFCLNPFLSCSVQSDGDVVPCCFAWEKDLVMGNIKKHSLQEIWQGEKWQQFRKEWLNDNLPHKCKMCRMRSPQLLHYRFILNWQSRKWL